MPIQRWHLTARPTLASGLQMSSASVRMALAGQQLIVGDYRPAFRRCNARWLLTEISPWSGVREHAAGDDGRGDGRGGWGQGGWICFRAPSTPLAKPRYVRGSERAR